MRLDKIASHGARHAVTQKVMQNESGYCNENDFFYSLACARNLTTKLSST